MDFLGSPSTGVTPATGDRSKKFVTAEMLGQELLLKQASLGFTPVQQSGGSGQLANKLYLGWSGNFTKLQVDSTDLGRVWTDIDAGRSLAVSGYQKLPGGLIIQWGAIAAGDGATVTFPISFPTRSCAIVPAPAYAGAGTAETATVFISASSSSGFTVRTRFANNGGLVGATAAYTVHWIAIGY